MDINLIKANLNLYAVLKNLEDIVKYDPEISKLSKDWKLSIQFKVRKGPNAYIEFNNGECTVNRGKKRRAGIILYFFSPGHLNKMFDGKGSPIPLRGISKLKFLTGDFIKLTGRLEYYLKPKDELLKDKSYLALNTRLTLNTAAYALREIGELDKIGRAVSAHMRDGAVLLKVLPDGPSANVTLKGGKILPAKGDVDKPMAVLSMKNMSLANDFLNGKVDTFAAVASGDVEIKGQTPMLDSLSLLLDRIPVYLT
ncbi:MAG: hypothetical protein MUC95_01505 [Spirochaetes bacterium]|jgi:putative sterol carrier protein|nr:hypothetical protein [Spirochaetota bacterium]